MSKINVQVSAELIVSIAFGMEMEDTLSAFELQKQAVAAANRVAQSVVGQRGDSASAHVQRVTSFSVRLT